MIAHAVGGDGEEPRSQRPGWLIGRSGEMNLHEYLLKHVVAARRWHTASHQIAVDRCLIGLHQLAEGRPVAAAVPWQPVALVQIDDRFHGFGFETHACGSPGNQVLVVHGRDEKVSARHRILRRILGSRP